jgi:hypothetical protein
MSSLLEIIAEITAKTENPSFRPVRAALYASLKNNPPVWALLSSFLFSASSMLLRQAFTRVLTVDNMLLIVIGIICLLYSFFFLGSIITSNFMSMIDTTP